MKIYYIAETNTSSLSGYAIHVMKMCDAFSLNNIQPYCIFPYQKKVSEKKISKNYLLRGKKKIKLISIFKSEIKNNFFNRLIFSYKIAIFLKKKKPSLILTRSLLSSVFLSLFKINHFLEIHHEIKGISKLFLINLNFISSKYIIKNIFISKQLQKLHFSFVKNYIILPDGVDIKNFPKIKKNNQIKKFCYMGSFYDGRGLDKIYRLSRYFKNHIFHLYGRKVSKNKIKNTKNFKVFNYVNYHLVPKILSKYDVLLMPYENSVMVNSNNLDTSKYMSPLKMFEYLASGKIIISSNHKVLKEILVNKYNSFIVKNNSAPEWIKTIKKIFKTKNINKINHNAKKTAEKYTWFKRAEKIKSIYLNFI